MAKKTKEIKPFPTVVSVLLLLVAFLAMGVFVAYLVSPSGGSDVSHVDSLGEQSFEEETSIEPPPPSIAEVKEYMSDADVGDVVTFGAYEQNGIADDGKEPIEWVVLTENETGLLLVSRYCLDCQPYNTVRENVNWESSSLRAWLNSDFYNAAFNAKEQSAILEITETSSAENSPSVTDRVSMLTFDYARIYYEYDSWRTAQATAYAESQGARVEDGNCWWWLRGGLFDNGSTSRYVHFDGSIKEIGFAVDYNSVAVRPTIWVSADAEKETESSADLSE